MALVTIMVLVTTSTRSGRVSSITRTVLFIYVLSICMSLTAMVLRYVSTGEALFFLAQAVIIVLLVTILERVGHREGNGAEQAMAQDVSRQHFSESVQKKDRSLFSSLHGGDYADTEAV